ncbi:MAG: DUF2723 domain-containing protein [Sandaracinus sp.]|nr:DUF2723 domain-containing protein [Sandaracinus sp.]MCB9631558.1 DUF2723 domain-containing protein [Sandaracinus sp.]
MASADHHEGGPWPAALAVGVPLAAWLASTSAHGYWLDSGELVAQSADFGVSHPPGHPLFGLVTTLLGFVLPLGSMAYRVALASALFSAGAALCVFRAARETFHAAGAPARASSVLAIASTWLACGSYGWWLQAVRPEVYALQAFLVMFAIERLVALEAAWPSSDVRPLYHASLALGLALANHHFLGLLLLPAGAATLARVVAARGKRPLFVGMGLVSVGVALYVYLPLRADRAFLALGHPDSLGRFWWVVSAQAFQKNQGSGVPEPFEDRAFDVLTQLGEGLHVATLLLALMGAYVLVRRPAGRRIGVLWTLVLVVFVAARIWLGFVRQNPDALGYLMPAFAATAVLAGAAVATLASFASERVGVVIASLALGLALVPPATHGRQASLAGFRDTDLFDDALRRELPPRAVLIAHEPSTIFRFWGGEATERSRPDVTLVPVPFLTYPELVEAIAAEAPELRPLLGGYLLEGRFGVAELQTLASERPVMVELDLRVPRDAYETLAPAGLEHRVLAAGATETDVREGTQDQLVRWAELERLLGPVRSEETRRQILWRSYMHALFSAEVGERDAARAHLARGLAIAPNETALRDLLRALGEGEGPMDTTLFRVDQDE